jgi:peptidyl-dipeptidase Dcp
MESNESTRTPPVDPVVVEALLGPWKGPYGGLPPFDVAKPAAIERAFGIALERKRAEVRAIAESPAAPTFENTVEALEDTGRELRRVSVVYQVFASTMGTPEMREVEKNVAPLLPGLEDEIAHDDALFARIESVWQGREAAGLTKEQARLTELLCDRLKRRGAGLPAEARARLAEINSRIAALQARFSQNLVTEQDGQAVVIEDEGGLEGLGEDQRVAAAQAAAERGRPGAWAIPNKRPAVWPFLTKSVRRDLREKVWRMWTMRGDNPGESDNKPVVAEILRLRGEKARLLGFPTFAHFATADRMARTPEAALELMTRAWEAVIGPTRALVADLQAIADAEGADIRIAPWDRLFYSAKLREARYAFDADEVRQHLDLESVLAAIFWAAGRVHGVAFRPLPDAPVCHPSIRVFEVSRGGEPVGLVWLDVLGRPGKMHGSWQAEYRPAESFRGRVLPISSVNSGLPPPRDGEPVLLPWEYANVLFHEFGHALHMLLSEARYPSLGSVNVAWDFVELPSFLNERWLLDRELLGRFARHHRTGAPMSGALVQSLERALRFDRVLTLNLDYLGGAIVDMRMHLLADGRDVDAVRLEEETLAQLGMPEAWDLIMRVPHCWHAISDGYAAGLYSYLWSDVLASEVLEAFLSSPGGLWDAETAERWRRTILSVGTSVPAEEALRAFLGREPDPGALFRRFGLEAAS